MKKPRPDCGLNWLLLDGRMVRIRCRAPVCRSIGRSEVSAYLDDQSLKCGDCSGMENDDVFFIVWPIWSRREQSIGVRMSVQQNREERRMKREGGFKILKILTICFQDVALPD